jgi:hypothetical protein
VIFVAVGLVLVFGPKIPFLGKLPGDFHFKKGNFELYVPLATSILLSLLVSGILWVIQHVGKK